MLEEHELKFDGCTYRCYLKSVKMQTTDDLVSIHPSGTQPKGLPVESSYFRVYCRRVDPKCKVVLSAQPAYHRMTIGKFIDKYDLQIGDPVVSHAWAFAKETKPGLPKGVDGQEIVKATITGFFTSAVTGEPMARLRVKKIIAYSRSKGPVDPKSKHADALKDWEGVNSINEIGYGEVHKRFIKEAMGMGEKIPAKVLQEYPEL